MEPLIVVVGAVADAVHAQPVEVLRYSAPFSIIQSAPSGDADGAGSW
ncbi:hypothetical protein VSR01_01635 [Actinacidiphila sp. DG2A-62]|nr:hypothetical protein [Actinacidiphila sp. DG2A-62]MEC3992313.1 hypothetical protein [Actinacidiphila sp. DG2A-62]